MERLGGIVERSLARGTGKFSGLLGQCESVIEQAFAAAFLVNNAFTVTPVGKRWRIERAAEALVLASQYELVQGLDPWANGVDPEKVFARADFAFLDGENDRLVLVVEADGHDWHEKNKKQIASDRARDRRILRCGIPIARFTGAEIHASAGACGVEAFAMALTLGAAH